MKYDLKKLRTDLGLTIREMGSLMGITTFYYSGYEKEGEIPSKYLYALWEKNKSIPLPADFFFYTSGTLKLNMVSHNMTQTDIAKMFGFDNQSTISALLKENIPMYELKEVFNRFDPLIIGMEVVGDRDTESKELTFNTKLQKKGNFIRVRKIKENKRSKAIANA